MGQRISQLDLAGPLSGSEYFAVVQEGKTKKVQATSFTPLLETSCKCTLVSRHGQIGIEANTLEQYIDTYQVPPNTLKSYGEYLLVKAWGTLGNNSDTKQIVLKFGNENVYSQVTTIGLGNKNWQLEAIVARETANTQNGYSFGNLDTSSAQISAPLENLGTSIPIALAFTSGTATVDNITRRGFIIELHKIDVNS